VNIAKLPEAVAEAKRLPNEPLVSSGGSDQIDRHLTEFE
jgi:hypothetical protein